MSTATMDRPLRSVWTPADAEQVRRAVQDQKRRFGAFLIAKDAVLGYGRDLGRAAAAFLERCHLGRALRLASRACGWIVGLLSGARQLLGRPGVPAGVVWALTTTTGQGAVRRAVEPVWRLICGAGKTVATGVDALLRFFGNPGARLADRVQGVAVRVATGGRALRQLTRPALTEALQPSGLLMRALGAGARARVLSTALSAALPGRWQRLGRVLGSLLIVPSGLRRDALSFMHQASTAGPDKPTPPPATPAVRAVKAEQSVDEGSASTALVLNLEDAREGALASQPDPGLQRYPAPKRKTGSKNRR